MSQKTDALEATLLNHRDGLAWLKVVAAVAWRERELSSGLTRVGAIVEGSASGEVDGQTRASAPAFM